MVLGRVLGDSTAALTRGEARPPVPTETPEGDAWRLDLPESVTGLRPTAKTTPSESETSTEGSRSHRRDDGGAQLALAEGVVLWEACVGETTHERCDNGGACDCGTSAYSETYSGEGGWRIRAPKRTRQTGQREASCDEEEGTQPSLSEW